MKKLLLAILFCLVSAVSVYGAQTHTTAKGIHNKAPYIQHVMTADTTGEAACADVEGYDHCTVKVDVGATINVDIDWGIAETYDENFVVDTSLTNVTSDTIGNLSTYKGIGVCLHLRGGTKMQKSCIYGASSTLCHRKND